MFEKVAGAPLVSEIEQRAAYDQQEHDHYVGLFRDWRYGRGKRGEWVVHEHWLFPPKRVSVFQRDADAKSAPGALQAPRLQNSILDSNCLQ